VAILIRTASGALELLCSSSHRIEGIELLQIQTESGPCADVLHSDVPIRVSGAEALVARWGEVGTAIVAAGFDEAHAYPMRWRGQSIGGLNIFLRSGAVTDAAVGQLFADLATLAVLQANDISADQLVARVHDAVGARAVIEQAKGVLAYRDGLDMDQAYTVLLETARRAGKGLSSTAADVIDGVQQVPADD
jgi:hypothetical protein